MSENLFEYFSSLKDVMVNVNEESGLASIKYVHMGVDWSIPHMLEARGLVITQDGEIVGRPYDKFFNYHQLKNFTGLSDEVKALSDWRNEDFYTLDKVDGSLVIAYTHNDKLFLSSSGSVYSEHSKAFERLLETYPKETRERLLEVGKTYTISMEYISPSNQIVIVYPEPKFILHGARVTKTGEYMTLEQLEELSNYLMIDLVEVDTTVSTLEDLLNKIHVLKNKEGFVVVFKSNHRLKFKTDEYVQLHDLYMPLFSGVTTPAFANRLYTMIVEDTLDDFIPIIDTVEDEGMRARIFDVISIAMDVLHELDLEVKAIWDYAERNLQLFIENKKEFISMIRNESKFFKSVVIEISKRLVDDGRVEYNIIDLINEIRVLGNNFKIRLKENIVAEV